MTKLTLGEGYMYLCMLLAYHWVVVLARVKVQCWAGILILIYQPGKGKYKIWKPIYQVKVCKLQKILKPGKGKG
jgi:hypothetical protein